MAMIKTCKMPDLQEKSASGSVASFNTALAMPLASCNIAVNAWQEGSGDPSPVNNRPIHGFSEVNATRAGKNLLDFNSLVFAKPSSMSVSNATLRKWVDNSYCVGISHNNYANPSGVYEHEILMNGLNVRGAAAYGVNIPLKLPPLSQITVSAESITNGKIEVAFYGVDGTWLSSSSGNLQIKTFTVPANAKWSVIIFTAINSTTIAQFRNILVEVGSTATAYVPYVTPTIYTIQLGQEVYGAEVDVVNGVAHCTWKKTIVDENSTLNMTSVYIKSDACDAYYKDTDVDTSRIAIFYNKTTCNYLKRTARNTPIWSTVGYPNCYTINSQQLHFNIANDLLGITDYTQETTTTATEKIKNYLSNNNLEFLVPITPFDIQLTPTQIETLIGNNTIFADTGDIDLTYKDLDIAKRGNFREVFKLP